MREALAWERKRYDLLLEERTKVCDKNTDG